MVVNAKPIFSCRHEYIAFPDHVLCHLCGHIREELPFSKSNRKSLLFFPVSVREQANARQTG